MYVPLCVWRWTSYLFILPWTSPNVTRQPTSTAEGSSMKAYIWGPRSWVTQGVKMLTTLYYVSQKKRAPMNKCTLPLVLFKKGCFIQIIQQEIILFKTTLTYHLPQKDLNSFLVMTCKVNLDHNFLPLSLYGVSQPLNRKIIKVVLHLNLRLKSYLEN